jgi:hypothetical protein
MNDMAHEAPLNVPRLHSLHGEQHHTTATNNTASPTAAARTGPPLRGRPKAAFWSVARLVDEGAGVSGLSGATYVVAVMTTTAPLGEVLVRVSTICFEVRVEVGEGEEEEEECSGVVDVDMVVLLSRDEEEERKDDGVELGLVLVVVTGGTTLVLEGAGPVLVLVMVTAVDDVL